MESRPKVGDAVMRLKEAMTGWVGLMPPCSPTGDIGLDSGEPVSDSEEPGEFDILIFPWCCSSDPAQISFNRPQVTAQESSIKSQTTSELLRRQNTESTRLTNPQK